MNTIVCPVIDCQLTVDVVLRSSDGVHIGGHKSNLESYSEGFPPADATSNTKEPVDLTEDSGTLMLLMHFMHRTPYPDVYPLPFSQLLRFAYAAEKYMVHSAMGVANVCIRARVNEYPVSALAYATRFNYPTIADAAAPMTIAADLETMKKNFQDGHALCAWLQYKMTYLEEITKLFNRVSPSSVRPGSPPQWIRTRGECLNWAIYASEVQSSMPNLVLASLSSMVSRSGLESVFGRYTLKCRMPGCSCSEIADQWAEDATTLLSDIPKLTTYLSR